MKSKHVNIPIFVPHKGCPNDCSFCNQKKITGQQKPMTADGAQTIIKEHLETINKEITNVEIAFFGGSFTGIPQEEQQSLLEAASSFYEQKLVDGIRLSTRPDYINKDILSFLKNYNVTAIELGAQSMLDDVLLANDRGHTSEDTKRASNLIRDYGFELGLQMMTGLYCDNREGAIYTAERLIELKPACVRIYPTLIIKDTKLHRLYEEGKYIPMELDETVNLCSELIEKFDDAQIKVLRVGLLGTDNINDEQDVIAGSFHRSIGELAESEKFYNKLIRAFDLKHGADILISVHPRYVSIAVGHRKKNILRLRKKFPDKNVGIIQDISVPYGSFMIK